MLKIGNLNLKVPIVLSPMADYTNLPYRILCSEKCESGLFIEEMVSTKAILNTKKPIQKFVDTSKKDEKIRSVQLYCLTPDDTYYGVKKVLDNDLADHIDLNFGCPVRKVTRNGGGSAIPLKPKLLENIVKSAKKACGNIPLTVKIRLGINKENVTYLSAGKIAEANGADGIILHTRYTSQYYHGRAAWECIKKLKETVGIPVIGNGDIITISDYERMVNDYGADGVAIGRGALGRPWIFSQISDYVLKNKKPEPITVKVLIKYINKHLKLMLKYCGGDEKIAIKLLRKFYIFYFKGVNIGGALRNELVKISSIDEQNNVLEKIADKCGKNTEINENFIRGRQGNMHKVYLPDGWLKNSD